MSTQKSACKLVYFNRVETDLQGNKMEENEVYSLRNIFEMTPQLLLYVVNYYAPMDNGCNGLYQHNFRACNEKHVRKLFDAWKIELGADSRMHIKNVVLVEKALFRG